MRRPVTVLAALAALTLVLLLAAPAFATTPDPDHHVIAVKGRNLFALSDPGVGRAVCSAQGELVDTNANGLADALRGRAACVEDFGVDRFRIYSIRLQVLRAQQTWDTIAVDDTDFVSSGQPSRVTDYTPTLSYCPHPPFPLVTLTYRIQALYGVRWIDGTLTVHSRTSFRFDARAVVNTGVC
jgi:hypothetical protein